MARARLSEAEQAVLDSRFMAAALRLSRKNAGRTSTNPSVGTLIVRDDGRGFDADHPPSATSGHFGLFGMRERAIKLEADLRVTSQPGEGSAIQIDVPLASPNTKFKPEPTPTGLRLAVRPSTS